MPEPRVLSLADVAQIAVDRVEAVMHLPPAGESRSSGESHARAVGEPAGLPATQDATTIGPLGSTSATLSKPQDSRSELVESGPRLSELTGGRPAPQSSGKKSPVNSFQVGDYFADERYPSLRIVGIVVDVRRDYIEGAILTRSGVKWQFETGYVMRGEDAVKLARLEAQ